MEYSGFKLIPDVENLTNEVIRILLGAELNYIQLSALCFNNKLDLQHTAEYLRECSLQKRTHAEKWIQFLATRGGQFRIERIEVIIPVLTNQKLEQDNQLKIILELAVNIERKVEDILHQLHHLSKNVRDEVTVEIIESHSIPKQIKMIRQIESQLNSLHRQGLSEYIFEKLTIKPLVNHIKERANKKLLHRIYTTRAYDTHVPLFPFNQIVYGRNF